ncbi:DUF5701 family protein [Micromonospora sp. NPDC049679]|uniref:DUF5701 family protein n=1 Tax=Micromonospora sp. NPDC049679 TaxID=3155920 RepID=UPI0033CF3D16
MTATPFDAGAEFDRQVRTLLDKGYPELCGLAEEALVELVAPLRQTAVTRAASLAPPTEARVPFVLVITKQLAPAGRAMPLTALKGKPGYVDFEPEDIGRFDAIKELEIPDGPAYLVFDIDRGAETRNVTPDAAMVTITAQGRTPLTVDEGIAFITHHPGSLQKNNCFSLVGSRCGDRRVPALWISKGAPKLGWCWAGNPHTWLGSASCDARAGSSAVPVSA